MKLDTLRVNFANDNKEDITVNLRNLISILEKEIILLDAMKIKELADFQTDKILILENIEESVKKVSIEKKRFAENILEEIMVLSNHLNQARERYAVKLHQANLVHREVMNIIMQEIKKSIGETNSYNNNGRKNSIAVDEMPPVSLNEEI